MITIDRAKRILSYGQTAFLKTEEVASIASIKPVTLRQWIKRGHLELRFSPQVKTGKTMLFSFEALVETMAFASLSRLGFPPNRFSGDLASIMTSQAFLYLYDITNTWREYSNLSDEERNYQRYVIVFYDPPQDDLEWFITSTTTPEEEIFDGTWIVLDSHLLMQRAIEGLDRLKDQYKAKE